ncbi:unnamed protein product [Acanthoscelides obtectus]|uniref:Uncharacterized protein n=1 Tax=Acanthoscelides obtectus TaxID=200917 RepID=A0A9P0PU30_ACAOB|nr:unnamed protein product [Acanthoscelides obtectus]CAK1684206.1 hypothetical protein AOBTE_LOCUS34704 [Acanthoscelides obtectus]
MEAKTTPESTPYGLGEIHVLNFSVRNHKGKRNQLKEKLFQNSRHYFLFTSGRYCSSPVLDLIPIPNNRFQV